MMSRIPNKLTRETLEKAERGEDVHTVDSVEELFEELESDDVKPAGFTPRTKITEIKSMVPGMSSDEKQHKGWQDKEI